MTAGIDTISLVAGASWQRKGSLSGDVVTEERKASSREMRREVTELENQTLRLLEDIDRGNLKKERKG